jgi:hypothetical protein
VTGHEGGRKLRYSERLELADTGSLRPFEFDAVPDSFLGAFLHLVERAGDKANVGSSFSKALRASLIEHFGLKPPLDLEFLLRSRSIPEALDVMEIVAEESKKLRSYQRVAGRAVGGGVRYANANSAALPDFEQLFNDLADRHRLGYRLEENEIRRVASPALSEVVVGPALLSTQRAGWDQVERSYKEALHHQRGGRDENDDALTAAAAALEAALKAAGVRGKTLGELGKEFRASNLGAPQLATVPSLLHDLLQRTGALRNMDGDAHGRGPGEAPEVPQELVDLAVHLTGAFIVYLERTTR